MAAPDSGSQRLSSISSLRRIPDFVDFARSSSHDDKIFCFPMNALVTLDENRRIGAT